MKRIAYILLATTGCTETPLQVVEEIRTALEIGEREKVARNIHPSYADPLGDRQLLLAHIDDLFQRFPKRTIDLAELTEERDESQRHAHVIGRLDAELVGEITWKIDGHVRLELKRDQRFYVLSGLLHPFFDMREIMEKRRAALEANDAGAMADLLHPGYRDGDLDKTEALARLAEDLRGKQIRIRATNYRLELRGRRAHLDEHYRLTVNGKAVPPAVARFTVEPSAGRWRIAAGLYPPR